MEEYVEIPTEMDTQDIEIRTCDEVTAGSMTDTDTAQHFYIVQQTPEGLVIQIAEPNDADGSQSGPGLSKQADGTTVVHLSETEAAELLLNAGLVTSDGDTANVMSRLFAAGDIVSVAASEINAGDVVTSELVDGNGDNRANGQVGDRCEATVDAVHSTDIDGSDAAGIDGEAPAGHVYTNDGQQSVATLVDNSSTDVAPDVTENVQDQVSDITLDGTPSVQEQVSNDTAVQENMSDGVESEVNSEETVSQAAVDPSDLSTKDDATKAAPSRRVSTRARKRRVTNEAPSSSPGATTERSDEELQPKMKAYQKWQRLPSNTDKAGMDDTDEASASSSDMVVEMNEVSKQAGKRKSFTTVVANRKVCYARKENNATSEKSANSSDVQELNTIQVRVDGNAPKSPLLTEISDIHSLKAEVDQLQKLNAELKSQMKQMEQKTLLHHGNRKMLTASSDRMILSSGGDRRIGINWKDMKFSVRKSASPRNTSPKESTENKAYLKKIDGLASQGRELLHREEMAEKKEQRLKALDMELDRRSSMIKCKEAKLERLESQLRARENALVTREKRLSNRESREEDAGERVAGQPPKEGRLNEREKQLRVKEKELEMRQELLRTTERQLTALGQELTDRFHYLQMMKQSGRGVAMATASKKSRQARTTEGPASKLTALAGSDSNNNRNARTAPAAKKATPLRTARKVAPLGDSKKTTQIPAARKVTKVAVTAAKRTNHLKLKAVGNLLRSKKNAIKKQPSKVSNVKPPGRAQKVVLKRKRTADKDVSRQGKRRKV